MKNHTILTALPLCRNLPDDFPADPHMTGTGCVIEFEQHIKLAFQGKLNRSLQTKSGQTEILNLPRSKTVVSGKKREKINRYALMLTAVYTAAIAGIIKLHNGTLPTVIFAL